MTEVIKLNNNKLFSDSSNSIHCTKSLAFTDEGMHKQIDTEFENNNLKELKSILTEEKSTDDKFIEKLIKEYNMINKEDPSIHIGEWVQMKFFQNLVEIHKEEHGTNHLFKWNNDRLELYNKMSNKSKKFNKLAEVKPSCTLRSHCGPVIKDRFIKDRFNNLNRVKKRVNKEIENLNSKYKDKVSIKFKKIMNNQAEKVSLTYKKMCIVFTDEYPFAKPKIILFINKEVKDKNIMNIEWSPVMGIKEIINCYEKIEGKQKKSKGKNKDNLSIIYDLPFKFVDDLYKRFKNELEDSSSLMCVGYHQYEQNVLSKFSIIMSKYPEFVKNIFFRSLSENYISPYREITIDATSKEEYIHKIRALNVKCLKNSSESYENISIERVSYMIDKVRSLLSIVDNDIYDNNYRKYQILLREHLEENEGYNKSLSNSENIMLKPKSFFDDWYASVTDIEFFSLEIENNFHYFEFLGKHYLECFEISTNYDEIGRLGYHKFTNKYIRDENLGLKIHDSWKNHFEDFQAETYISKKFITLLRSLKLVDKCNDSNSNNLFCTKKDSWMSWQRIKSILVTVLVGSLTQAL